MVSRRAFLGGALVLTACSSTQRVTRTPAPSPSPTPTPSGQTAGVTAKQIAYGPDASQFGELSIPAHPFHAGVVVIIHGGFWQAAYGLELGRPLAVDLASHGYTCWNLEYRRVGDGGGWPATFEDIAAGIDHLATLDVDTSSVVAVGHSAGGQLAVWAAGTRTPAAAAKVKLTGVASQAGVLDLAVAQDTGVGTGSPAMLMGGTPGQVPTRYHEGDPIRLVPAPLPVLCVHARGDANVPYSQSTAYVAAATKAGGRAALHTVAGDHFTLIDPTSAAWAVVRNALPSLLDGQLPA